VTQKSRDQIYFVLRALLTMTLAFSLARPSRADPPPASRTAEAETHRIAAERYFNLQQYSQAAEEFRQVYRLTADPRVLYAVAQSERLGSDCARAVRSYEAYLRSNPPASQAESARSNLAKCDEMLRASSTAGQVGPAVVTTQPGPPPRKWYRDLGGGLAVGLGLATTAVGIGLFVAGNNGVGNEGLDLSHYADSNKWVDTRTAGLVLIGVGSAAVVAGVIRYAWVGSRNARATH
jgi:hypothetical protein